MSPNDFLAAVGGVATSTPPTTTAPAPSQGAQSGNARTGGNQQLQAAAWTAGAFLAFGLLALILAHLGRAR